MTKAEMISKLRDSVDGITKDQAAAALDAMIDIIGNEIVESGNCKLHNFGTFTLKTRAARNGVNPRTGEKIQIAESKAITFSAASALKDKVNK